MADPPEQNIDDLADQEVKKIGDDTSSDQKKKQKTLQEEQRKLDEREKRIQQGEKEISDLVGNQNKPTPETGLEGKTQGFFETLKSFSVWDWMKVGAVNAAGALFGGGIINLAATSLSYLTAHYLTNRKKGFDSNSVKDEMYLGGLMTAPLHFMFSTLHTIGNPLLRWGAWLGVALPVFNSLFLGTQYIVKNYTPYKLVKGLFNGETYKAPFKTAGYVAKNFWPTVKGILKYFAIPVYFVLNHTPLALNIPVSSAGRVLYRYALQKSIDEKETNYKKESSSPSEYASRTG